MADYFKFEVSQGIRAVSKEWYKCVQLLGTGGNAVTFLVSCTSGENEGVLFALKVFRKLSQPKRRGRFLEEIRFLQRCSHPALMRVYDSGVFVQDGGNQFPFVIAEYLPQRLFDVIRGGQATTTQKISYALQLLSALTYLSKLDPAVVHRDIKPRNIFVKGGSCVLGDFGLMKLLDKNVEEDRQILTESMGGMPFYYRTPDLIAYARKEAEITTKSDVFQLGLVLTELFTGRNPAIKPRRILDDFESEPLGKVPGGLSGSIAALLNRMLVLDTATREDAVNLLDPWQGLFWNAVEKAHELDGKVI
jgi:serine/threonine protein kinase